MVRSFYVCKGSSQGVKPHFKVLEKRRFKAMRLPVILDRSEDIRRVAITDTNVAAAVVIASRELLINAKAPGVTNVVLWSRAGDRHFFTVKVTPDVAPLQDHIRSVFPGEDIRVEARDGVITLSGKVSSREVAEKVLGMAAGFGR